MDTLTLVVVIAVASVAVLAVAGTTLLRRRPRKAPLPPLTEPTTERDETPSGDVKVLTPEAPADLRAPPGVAVEQPEPTAGRLARLRSRLAGQRSLGRGLLGLLSRDKLDEQTWEEVEEVLLGADVGVGPTQDLVERLRRRLTDGGDPESARSLLREELLALVDPDLDRSLHTAGSDGRPAVVLVVGVNGTGKTTSVGKLARVLVADGRTVLLGAADTFRAAAADQLQTWGERVGAPVVRGPEGGDPASVAFDAVKQGAEGDYDVVLVDTAGRLQNKVGLMDELGKVKRVVEKHGPVDETLLVLDATTGQNGIAQARAFAESVEVTGVALTKLDGTAKGGVVLAVRDQLGVPVKVVGTGESVGDLEPFDSEAFAARLLGG
jgi:fused signal recognition particle receptor